MAQEEDTAPSWLTETEPTPAAAPAPPSTARAATPASETPPAPAPAPVAADTSDDPTELTPEEQSTLKGIILFTRMANLIVSIAIMVMSVFRLIAYLANPQYYVLCFYAALGSSLICCLETQLSFIRTGIALNFGFLFSPIPRFLFYILLATICWSLYDIFAKICAGCLVGIAFYNTYVLIRYPAYRKLRDKIAKEEDDRIGAAIREKVRKDATAAMFKN